MTRTPTMRAAALLGALTIAIGLAGCASEAPTQTPSTAPGGTSTPIDSPSPSTTENASPDPDDLSTWVITESGIGPVELGADFDETTAMLPTWTVDENCSWAAYWNAPDQSLSAYYAQDSEEPSGVTTIDLAASADTAAPDDVPRTAEGIGIGSTRDEVLAAHPDAAEQTPTIGGGTLLRVGSPADGAIFFAFPDGVETVRAVTVTSREEPPYEVCG